MAKKVQIKDANQIWQEVCVLGVGDEWTKLGTFNDIEEDDYHSIDACNQSRLKASQVSLKQLHHVAARRKKATDEMRLGSAIHTRLLQGDEAFSKQWAAGLDKPKRSAKDREAHADHEWACEQEGKRLLKHDLHRKITDEILPEAIQYPIVRAMSGCQGAAETSMFWLDTDWNLLCKSRPDLVMDNVMYDLKTCGWDDLGSFAFQAARLDYHIQAAHYLEGANLLGTPAEQFVIVVIQTVEPYEVRTYKMADDALELAYRWLPVMRRRYAHACTLKPSDIYEMRTDIIDVPEWKYKVPLPI